VSGRAVLPRFDHPHLRAVFRTAPEPVTPREVVIGIVGVAVPVMLGFLFGQTALGLGIGLGAMLLGGGSSAAGAPLKAIALALAAVGAALLFAGASLGDAALVLLAGTAALLGGYSRPLAISSVRFCIYLVLAFSVIEVASDRALAAGAFTVGALWNVALRRVIAGVGQAAPPSPYSHAQRIAAFHRRLRELNSWNYALRLVVGLGAASVLRQLWSGHHGGWLLITVVLLTTRSFERFPVKVTQRALGVTLGVVATWTLFALAQTTIATVAVIVALAAAIPVLRARSYLLYSAAMTPMILLVLDFGQPRHGGVLVDRLIATIVGSAIVLAVNWAMDGVLARARSPVA
jgi:hypothetical protein